MYLFILFLGGVGWGEGVVGIVYRGYPFIVKIRLEWIWENLICIWRRLGQFSLKEYVMAHYLTDI